MDKTPAMEKELESWYHYLIGMLTWMVKIGRVDIITEVSIMASQMAMSGYGHVDALLHVFVFIRKKYNSRMDFDLTYPTIDISDFKEWKWKYLYGELK